MGKYLRVSDFQATFSQERKLRQDLGRKGSIGFQHNKTNVLLLIFINKTNEGIVLEERYLISHCFGLL